MTVSMYRPDGKVLYFTFTNGTWTSDSDINGRLTQLTNATGTVTGWKYVNVDDETEVYDANGKLLSIANRAGFTQSLAYSNAGTPAAVAPAAGLLISVTDASGRQLNFTYDASSRVSGMSDPAGGVYKYAYDSSGNLAGVIYPDLKIRTYLYGETAHVSATPNAGVSYVNSLTGIVDQNGSRFATWNYDAQGRATSSEHGVGIDKVVLTYNADGSTTTTDALGAVHTYAFSTVLGVPHNASLVDARGAMTRTYDANGNLASRTDFNGNVTTWQYDLTRNLETSRTEASGTALARTVATQWSPTFRLPILVSEPGRSTSYTYDSATGNLLTRTVTDAASNRSRTWTYTYTTAADLTLPNLLKTVKGPRTDVASLTSFGYYPNGDLKSIADALGHVTSITGYDGAGRPLAITDANGVVTTLGYTPRGWLASRKVGMLVTNYAYDGVGQITRVTLPDGSHLDYTYDAAHRLTDIADAKLDHVHYTLDAVGDRTREDVYDSTGKLSGTLSRVFDSLGRLSQDIRSYNAATSYATTYSYDGDGNLIKSVDARNNATLYGYDALNRISQMTDAALGITRYAYDGVDQLTGVTDPKSLNTRYAVNALGEETQLASPDSGTGNRSYDSAGNLAGNVDARGIAANYVYDALNRPVSVSYPATGENVAYVWDTGTGCSYGVGRLCQITDADGTTAFAYDDQGNLVQKTRTESGASFVTRYVYDAANRLVTVMTPGGETLSMTRDVAGKVQQVTDTSASGTVTIASKIQYDGAGRATSQYLGNGVTQTTGYDLSGQMGTTGSARPLGPSDIDAGTVRLFLSGSYLKQTLLEPALMGFFQPGSLSVFQDGTVTGGIGAATGANYRAYFGFARSTAQNAAIPASLSGKKVLIADTSKGDSIYGVTPVALASPIGILSVDATCAPTGGSDAAGQLLWACPNIASAVPDVGLADVEPALFQGINVPATLWLNPVQRANLTSAPVVGQAMGVIVTNNFTASNGQPSLTRAQIVSLMNGLSSDWSFVDASIAAGPVSVCRYAPGSGTQAAINALLFGFPCLSTVQVPAGHMHVVNFGAGGGFYTVIENASPAAAASCMGYVQNGTPAGQTLDITSGSLSAAPADATHVVLPAGGRGIGLMSLSRPSQNSVTEPYHFIPIAASAPTVENASTGMYDLLVESVMTRRSVVVGGIAPLAGGQLDLFNYISVAVGNPAILGAAKTPPVPGVAALANAATLNYDPATTVVNGQSILLNPVLRVDNMGNTCTLLEQVQ